MTHSTVLVVEDDPSLREALCDTLKYAGYPVVTAEEGSQALHLLENQDDIGLVLSDVQMSPMDGHALLKRIKQQSAEIPVVMMTAYGTIESAVQAMRNGASDYLIKPFEAEELEAMVGRYLTVSAATTDLIAEDDETRRLADLARRVAQSDATVLITGPSGTGKEVFARYIHQYSARAAAPFVAINCAAIPENMLEAMLFGYEKGAFTGAYKSAPGKFEQAQGGTLLLDEISEMPPALQAKLLRVLQEREVERLGGHTIIDLDVRVLATSNRVLREEVAAGRFREDLFYRLSVFPLYLSPLRERSGDIQPLAEYLLRRHGKGRALPEFSPAARMRLARHSWPGNVRELDNVIQRALILQPGEVLEADDIQFEMMEPVSLTRVANTTRPGAEADVPADNAQSALSEDLRTREQRLIVEALRAGKGSRVKAAEQLGISPRTLRYKLARMRESGVDLLDQVGAKSA